MIFAMLILFCLSLLMLGSVVGLPDEPMPSPGRDPADICIGTGGGGGKGAISILVSWRPFKVGGAGWIWWDRSIFTSTDCCGGGVGWSGSMPFQLPWCRSGGGGGGGAAVVATGVVLPEAKCRIEPSSLSQLAGPVHSHLSSLVRCVLASMLNSVGFPFDTSGCVVPTRSGESLSPPVHTQAVSVPAWRSELTYVSSSWSRISASCTADGVGR